MPWLAIASAVINIASSVTKSEMSRKGRATLLGAEYLNVVKSEYIGVLKNQFPYIDDNFLNSRFSEMQTYFKNKFSSIHSAYKKHTLIATANPFLKRKNQSKDYILKRPWLLEPTLFKAFQTWVYQGEDVNGRDGNLNIIFAFYLQEDLNTLARAYHQLENEGLRGQSDAVKDLQRILKQNKKNQMNQSTLIPPGINLIDDDKPYHNPGGPGSTSSPGPTTTNNFLNNINMKYILIGVGAYLLYKKLF